jgi:SpoVK/Ycf46/Vps4 family AAA+-type ATPase
MSSLNLVIGGVATTYLAKHLGLPNDPVTTMIGTTIISSLISEISTNSKTLNSPISLFEVKRKLGLSYYTVIIDCESNYYQKIITYLISNYKKILIQDNVEHNYNLDVDITNIKFTKNKITEVYGTHTVLIGLNQSTKNIVFESSSLNVPGLKKYIQELVSKNTFTTYLNLFLPIISHEVEPSNKKRKRDEDDDSQTKKDISRSIVKWKNLQVYTNKNLANTILSKSVQNELVDDLNNFIANEEYYNSKGIPYKRGYLLHGPPGTGKTSIIKAFASTYGFDIYIINMENVTQPEDIVQIFRGFDSAHSFHIICFEDIDRCPMFKPKGYYDEPDPNNNLGVRTLLNELDGIIEGNKRITVFTANSTSVLDKIEALCRPGRIDKKIEVGYCDVDQLSRLFAHYTQSDSKLEGLETISAKITPAHAVKTILSNPLMTGEEFKEKLNLGLVVSNDSSVSSEPIQTKPQSLHSRRYARNKNISWEKISKLLEKESDATNQLIEKITTCGTLEEIRNSVPNIIWGRNTRVKNIRKGLREASSKYKIALSETEK